MLIDDLSPRAFRHASAKRSPVAKRVEQNSSDDLRWRTAAPIVFRLTVGNALASSKFASAKRILETP